MRVWLMQMYWLNRLARFSAGLWIEILFVNRALLNGASHPLHWILDNVLGNPVTMLFIKPSLIILCDFYDEHTILRGGEMDGC